MSEAFPFGYPFPTAFYLAFYVLTLVIHVFFMCYVLAGSAYLATGTLFRGKAMAGNPVAAVLREWMPFVLSAAITAGVAPLLFIQILYRERFYTSNLLLFHRWMAILPVLIAAFYLLYLYKSKLVGLWPIWARGALSAGIFAAFAFVAWSWTENHLLSLEGRETWAEQYGSGSLIYRSRQLLPRLAVWFTGAFPTMAVLLGWQLWYRRDRDDDVPGSRRVSRLALVGLIAAAVSAAIYFSVLPPGGRAAVTSATARPFLAAAVAGLAVQLAGWAVSSRSGRLGFKPLLTATIGSLLTLTGTSVVREELRIATIGGLEPLYAEHARATEVGGLVVFLAFFLLNFGLIAAAVLLVKRNLLPAGSTEETSRSAVT